MFAERRLQQLSERRLLRSSEYGGQCLQLFPECGSDAGRKPEFAVILKGKLCDAIVREDLMCLELLSALYALVSLGLLERDVVKFFGTA